MTALPWGIMPQIWAERIVNSLPAGLLIALFAWMLLRAIGRRSAGTRFAVWFVTLLAIAALPLVGSNATAAGVAGQLVRPEFSVPAFYATGLFFAWLGLACFALLRVGVGFWRLRKIRKSCVPISTLVLEPALQNHIEAFGAERQIQICTCASVRVPTLIGFLKPVIILPAWALEQLSAAELDVILLHEFAHLHRRDAWTNLAQKIIRAVFFFHPAVWWIESRLSLEREMACDDRVLAETGNPRAYAECLVSVAEKSFLQRGLALAQAAVSHVRETSLRLTQILDAQRPGATSVWKPALGIMGTFVIVSLSLIPHAPRLIGFDQTESGNTQTLTAAVSSLPLPVPMTPVSVHLDRPARPGQVPKQIAAKLPLRERASSRTLPVQAKAVSPSAAEVMNVRWDDTATPQMLFVVQTVEYDGRGSAVWSVRVWRLTVYTPEAVRTVPPARST